MNTNLLALHGLKYNPFSCEIPEEALYVYPRLEDFCWRVENGPVREGGFSLVSGDPGSGKSVCLRILAGRLKKMKDVQMGSLTHPTSRLSDFYRELGDIFNVPLNYSNYWGGFKGLREKWKAHLQGTLFRPVLFIDEAQEMGVSVLNELRMLTSMEFDSQVLLSVILAGDQRLNALLRRDELLPLGSRIKVRFNTEHASVEQLRNCLLHLTAGAGNENLMTPELMTTLCEHAAGNYRVLCNLASELLATAAQQGKTQLDEKLYFDCFAQPTNQNNRRK